MQLKLKIKNKYLRYAILLGGAAALLLVVLFGMLEVTSTPTFCSSCHYMQPYIDAWEQSSHSEVTCIKCHFPPGLVSKLEGKFTAIAMVANYMTGVYKRGKPHADIPDESCLRSGCHEKQLLSDSLLYQDKIKFAHQPHLTELRRGKQLRCTSCHSQIVQGEHIKVTKSTCFLCHFKEPLDELKINTCTTCHTPPVKDDTHLNVEYDHSSILERDISCESCHGNMHVGDGSVPIERCSNCHAEPEFIEIYDDSKQLHQLHVTDHKIECQSCHLPIQHQSVSRSQNIVPECGSCHQNTHNAQLDLFTGQGAIGFEAEPNPMFESGLNCQACHVYHSELNGIADFGINKTADFNSCEICHGTGYNRILDQWQGQMSSKMKSIEKSFALIERNMNNPNLDERKTKSVQEKMRRAKHNFGMVKSGNIIHNISFYDKLLFSAYEDLQAIAGYLGLSNRIPEYSQYHNELIPSDCNNCHYGIEEVTSSVFNLTFKHKQHVVEAKMECAQCHSNRSQHGTMIMGKGECLTCHHEDIEQSCESCHRVQADLHSGNIDLGGKITAKFLHSEKVSCRNCHETTSGSILRTNRQACIKCHSEVYPQYIEEWKTDTKRELKRLKSILAQKSQLDLRSSQRDVLDNISRGLDKLERENSWGVHNPKLTRAAMEYYNNRLNYLRN